MRFGVFIYDGTEPIDLATFGVLSMARRVVLDIEICTVAPRSGLVTLANGLRVIADFDLASAPHLDAVIVTGGPGWSEQSKNPEVLDFIRARSRDTLLISVCTGALVLAASGVIDGKTATTKYETVAPEIPPHEIMRQTYPQIDVRHSSFIAYDKIVIGGGVSLCIDTTLHVLEKIFGPSVAAETARIIEYQRALRANLQHLPPVIIDR